MPTFNKLTKRFFQPTPDQLKLHFRRFEFKYLLAPYQYQSIRARVARRLSLDPFARSQGDYAVSSTYFDTPTLTSYRESKAGLKNRVKYRIRSYPDSTRSQYVFLEIKRKKDMVVFKDRSLISQNLSQKLLQNLAKPRKADTIVSQFQFAKARYLLRPKILVRYRREPFVGETQKLRITFDTNIQVSSVNYFYYKELWSRPVLPQAIVMEFKFTGSLPFWLANLVRHYDLERQPFSKYTLSLERVKSHLSWIIS